MIFMNGSPFWPKLLRQCWSLAWEFYTLFFHRKKLKKDSKAASLLGFLFLQACTPKWSPRQLQGELFNCQSNLSIHRVELIWKIGSFFAVVYINSRAGQQIRKSYLIQGAGYAQHITTCHPRFSDLPPSLREGLFSHLFHKCEIGTNQGLDVNPKYVSDLMIGLCCGDDLPSPSPHLE